MSAEEFKFCLQKIKDELVPYGLTRIIILGGEPFLHPMFKEFCKYAYQLFINTKVNIDVLTNGLILNTLNDNQIQEYKQWVNFIVTSYPHFKNNKIKKNKLLLDQSRLFFIPNNVDDNGTQNVTECRKQILPCLFVRDYKIYMCPFAGTIHIYNKHCNKNIPITKNDYLSIYNLTFNKLQNFINNFPKDICKYCTTGAPMYWTTKNYEEYKQIDPIKLFVTNYDEYNELFNGANILKNLDNNFINSVKKEASSAQTVKNFNSKINGELDIIIPYYTRTEDQFKNLYETLIEQKDIEKCHIYLISDNSPNEKEALKFFHPFDEKLNITLLKTAKRLGPGGARQYGINNSYNNYLFFLDSDDVLIDKKGLSKVINILKKEKPDILTCQGLTIMIDKNNEEKIDINNTDPHANIYSRKFLNENNISFKNYLICEDKDFTRQINNIFKKKVINSNILLYQYNSSSGNNLGYSTTSIDKMLWHNIVYLTNPDYLKNKNILNTAWHEMLTLNFLEKDIKKFSNEQIKKLIPIGICCVKIFYDNLSTIDKQKLTPPEKYWGSIAKIVYNKIINNDIKYNTINDYKNLIKQEINLSINQDLLLPLYEPFLKY